MRKRKGEFISINLEEPADQASENFLELSAIFSNCLLLKLSYPAAMQKIPFLLFAVLAPIFLISPLSARKPAAPVAEKTVEAKKPSLSFYYFDG